MVMTVIRTFTEGDIHAYGISVISERPSCEIQFYLVGSNSGYNIYLCGTAMSSEGLCMDWMGALNRKTANHPVLKLYQKALIERNRILTEMS